MIKMTKYATTECHIAASRGTVQRSQCLCRGKHPAAGAAESCSIYYVKLSLKDRAYCKAGMPDNQNVEKKIAAILRV